MGGVGDAIFGELTQGAFQKVVEFLKDHCEFDQNSLFLDIGSGLGKPNFHVSIDPGCKVSYGVELEPVRWHLSLHNLRRVLSTSSYANTTIFIGGDILDAKTFNPFSHIYSFDVGFSPSEMMKLATMFNRSEAKYYASFHTEMKMVGKYGFDLQYLGQLPTKMCGSGRQHTCYFYKRQRIPRVKVNTRSGHSEVLIDPLFQKGFEILNKEKDGVLAWIHSCLQSNRRTRTQTRDANQKLQE